MKTFKELWRLFRIGESERSRIEKQLEKLDEIKANTQEAMNYFGLISRRLERIIGKLDNIQSWMPKISNQVKGIQDDMDEGIIFRSEEKDDGNKVIRLPEEFR